MDLQTLYSGELLEEASQRLQSVRSINRKETPIYTTKVESPEVIKHAFLQNWLAFNYLFAIAQDSTGSFIMGEFGGVIGTRHDNEKQVLGISDASVTKVIYGIEQVCESRKNGDRQIISQLEQEIEMPLEHRAGITVVNGNRNIAHYDFNSCVARENLFDMISPHLYLLLSAEGVIVFSHKNLPHEHYSLNIPFNEPLARDVAQFGKDVDRKIDLLRKRKDEIVPEKFIAGFHYTYDKTLVRIRPLVSEKDNDFSFKVTNLEPSNSHLDQLGTSTPYGQITGTMRCLL